MTTKFNRYFKKITDVPFENNLLIRTSILHLFIRLFPKIRISQRFLSNSEVIFLGFFSDSRMRTASQSSSRASSRASSRGASRDTSPDRRDRRLSAERGYSPSHLPVLKKASPLHSKYII